MTDDRRSDSSHLERDQVFKMDRWSKYQWSRYVDGSDGASSLLERGEAKLSAFPRFTREVFGRLHGDLMAVDAVKPEDRWAAEAHRELEELPDFDRLRRRCRGDRVLAGEAACAFSEAVLDRLPGGPKGMEDPEPLREQVKGLLEFARIARETGENPTPFEKQIAELRRRGASAVAAAIAYAEGLDPTEVRRALRSACEAGHRAAEDVEQQLGAFCGWGTGAPALAGSAVDPEVKAELARHVTRSSKLQALAREAGRLRRIAAAKQRSKSDHAREEVVDVELGADLGRVLPSELAKLVDPVLSCDFARRYFERSLLQHKLGGKEPQGRGPIVVLLDQSTSMEGPREIWSKALALALLQIAMSQTRWCRLVGFNTRAVDVTDWDPNDVDPLQLIRAMEPFLGGGTAFEPPLREALEAIKIQPHLKRADLILITDGEAELSDAFVAEWAAAKVRHEFTCYAVHVDAPAGVAPSQLLAVADKVIGLGDIASDEAVATDVVFSI